MARLMLCGFGFWTVPISQQPLLLSSAPSISDRWGKRDASHGTFGGADHGAALVALLFYINGDRAPHAASVDRRFHALRKPCVPARVYGHVVFERFCFLGPETSVCFRMFRVLLYLFLSLHLHSTPRGVFVWRHGKKL